MRTILSLLLVMLTGSVAQSAEPAEAEDILRTAMMKSAEADQRKIDSGVAIRTLIKQGFVPRKPEPRADYVDYRRLRKPLTLFGHPVLLIEEEYMTTYIGCCVNAGIGLVIEKAGGTAELDVFLKENKCRANTPSGPEYAMETAGMKPRPGTTYISISCRELDLMAE
jgi:hypothetical protein